MKKIYFLFLAVFAFTLLIVGLSDAEGATHYTPVDGSNQYSPSFHDDPYLCAQMGVEAMRSWHWNDAYADVPTIIGDAIWEFDRLEPEYFATGRMTRCQVAYHLVAMSWWETSFMHSVWGMDREVGLVQVVPCDTNRHDRYACQNSYYAQSRQRPHSEWLAADPRRPVVWSLIRLTDREDGGFTLEGIRSHNGGGPLAYRYARRHFASIARIEDWITNPRYLDSMTRDVRGQNSPYRERLAGEPHYWTP